MFLVYSKIKWISLAVPILSERSVYQQRSSLQTQTPLLCVETVTIGTLTLKNKTPHRFERPACSNCSLILHNKGRAAAGTFPSYILSFLMSLFSPHCYVFHAIGNIKITLHTRSPDSLLEGIKVAAAGLKVLMLGCCTTLRLQINLCLTKNAIRL